MTTYTDVFGGSAVQASDVQFRAVALSASIVTVWPAFDTTGNACARIMKVTPSAGSLTVTLPDARLASAGIDILFDNPSATSFDVLDASGGVVCSMGGGQVKYLYLSDNSTEAGTWRVTLFGAGSSSLDAGQLAGYGVKAISNTLNFAPVVSEISSNTAVTSADRAKVFVWTGGSGTLTLPTTTGSTSDFVIEVHNQGSGTLTVATTGGVVIDGSSTIPIVVTESCLIHMGPTDWYTVGRGRNTQFNFTQLNKTVTGGTTNLSLTEASNVVQAYSGTLLSNQTVNQPAVVQVYYVSNNTSGAYTLTFGCVAGGTTVAVPQSQAAILFCDGTNIINANTSLSGGISAILFAAASAASPSAAFSTSNTGFYSSGTYEIGVAANGVYTGKFGTGGYKTEVTGAAAVQSISSGSTAALVADRPAGSVGSVRLRTAGLDRWSLDATSTAEAGANAGTNLSLNAYNDAGALLGTVVTIPRSTQVVTFTQPPVLTVTNLTGTASININGTVGATTPAAGTFTTLTSTGNAALGDAEAIDTHAIKGATTLLANSASAALTVTQTGAGNAFVVEDSASTDSTPFVIEANGQCVIGNTTHMDSAIAQLSLVSDATHATSSNINLYRANPSSTAASTISLLKSSGTVGARTIVASGDLVGSLLYRGFDGTNYIDVAEIKAAIDGTPGISNMPGRILFSTTADGASSLTERMRIDSVGRVGIGGAPIADVTLQLTGTSAGTGVTQYGLYSDLAAPSSATSNFNQYAALVTTNTTAFTLANYQCFLATSGTIGSTTITNVSGFRVGSGLTQGTNNYGFYSNIASAANRYNFYAAGTADNYFGGLIFSNGLIRSVGSTAIPAGGAQSSPLIIGSSTSNFGVYFGSGIPTLSAAQGSLYLRSDGNPYFNTSGSTTWAEIGFRDIPQNSQSAPYTLVLADAGKHILHPSADTTARTITIPANASVAFPIGTAVTFVNQNGAGVMTIAITSDTMRLAGAGTTGSRTLAANGVATAIKLTATEWIISGTGLT